MRRQPLICEFVHRRELSLADAARRVALIASAGIVLAILSAWLGAECFGQGPPVWGQQPAWRSPGISDQACGPQGCPPNQRRPEWAAVVKIDVTSAERRGGGIVHSLGSGTLIERWDNGNGVVVTNAHVVRERASDNAVIVDFVQLGYKAKGVVVDVDETWDVAAVVTRLPENVRPVPLRETLVELGEPLTAAGYPQGGDQISITSGRASQYNAPSERSGAAYMLTVAGAASQQGCSGGAILDSQGRLAAVLWGGERSYTAGTVCARILQRLRNLRRLLAGKWAPGRGRSGGVQLDPIQGKPPQPAIDIADLPPVNRPGQSPSSPPAQPAPPQNDSPSSGSAAGGELAGLRERIKELEDKIKSGVQGKHEQAGPAIADEGKQLAEDAMQAAAPSILSGLAEKLLPLALKTLGVTLGGATGLGGVGLAGWGAIKLLKGLGGVIARRRAASKAAKAVKTAVDQQGTASGTTPSGAGMPQSFDPQSLVASEMSRIAAAIKNDVQTQIDAKLSIIGKQAQATAMIETAPAPPPTIIQQQVENPNYIALKKAIETLAESPAMIPVVNKIYSYRDQLLTQAKPR